MLVTQRDSIQTLENSLAERFIPAFVIFVLVHHKIQMIFHVLLCVKSNGSKGQSWIIFHLAGVVSLNFVALKVEQILRIIDVQPFWVNFISVIVIIFAVT